VQDLVQPIISLEQLKGVPAQWKARALYGQLMGYMAALAFPEHGYIPEHFASVGALLARCNNQPGPGCLIGFLDSSGTPLTEPLVTMVDEEAAGGLLALLENSVPGTPSFMCPLPVAALLPIMVEDFPATHTELNEGVGMETAVERQRLHFTYNGYTYQATNLSTPSPSIFRIAFAGKVE